MKSLINRKFATTNTLTSLEQNMAPDQIPISCMLDVMFGGLKKEILDRDSDEKCDLKIEMIIRFSKATIKEVEGDRK